MACIEQYPSDPKPQNFSQAACPTCGKAIGAPRYRVFKPYQPGQMVHLCLDAGLDTLTLEIMKATLLACWGNVTEAARVLGISRKTIYNRLKGYDFNAHSVDRVLDACEHIDGRVAEASQKINAKTN